MKLEKRGYSSLTDKQHDLLVGEIAYIGTVAEEYYKKRGKSERAEMVSASREFARALRTLEYLCFIVPAEREMYSNALADAVKEKADESDAQRR